MRKTSHNRQNQKMPWVLVVLGAVIVVLVVLIWRGAFASVLWRIGVPVLSVRNPLSDLGAAMSSKTGLSRDNIRLRADLASTSAALADRELLYQENLQLKARLGRDIAVHSVLAGIVMRPPGVPYDTLIIDAGQAEGVTLGSYVSAGGTTLVGMIDEVYATASRVKLFSAPGESYQGLLAETAAHPAVPITVVGQGGSSMTAQLPAKTVIVSGDAVVLPGISGGYTAQVSHVDAKTGESFETVYLHLPVNTQELQYVEVMLH